MNNCKQKENLFIYALEERLEELLVNRSSLSPHYLKILKYDSVQLRKYLQKMYLNNYVNDDKQFLSLLFYILQNRKEFKENVFYIYKLFLTINSPFVFYFILYNNISFYPARNVKKYFTLNNYGFIQNITNFYLNNYLFSDFFSNVNDIICLIYSQFPEEAINLDIHEILEYYIYCIKENNIESAYYRETIMLAINNAKKWDIGIILRCLATLQDIDLIEYATIYGLEILKNNIKNQVFNYHIISGFRDIVISIGCINNNFSQINRVLNSLLVIGELEKQIQKSIYKQKRLESGKIKSYKNQFNNFHHSYNYEFGNIYETISILRMLDIDKDFNHNFSSIWDSEDEKQIVEIDTRKIRNEVRDEFGIHRIGEGWISETLLYKIVSSFLKSKNVNVIHHFRPDFLNGQELDIYFEYNGKKIGIEYQGIQHFKPIDIFGGEDGFQKTKERDVRKREKCVENDITLIYFDYMETISKSLIAEKLNQINLKL